MSPSNDGRPIVNVALIGNPNTGKSTLFGALVGVQQRVGNYPGVTVEKKTGQFSTDTRQYNIVDLPGLYSLAPRSRDEMVAVDVLIGHMAQVPPVDAVVCIVDASNLQRNLYLVGQALDLGLPTVIVLNKLDLAEQQGVRIDVDGLRSRLPVPLVVTQANRALGIDELKQSLDRLQLDSVRTPESVFPEPFEREVAALAPLVEIACGCQERRLPAHWLSGRLLLDTSGYLEQALLAGRGREHRRRGRHGKPLHGCSLAGECSGAQGCRRGRRDGQGRGPRADELRGRLAEARARLVEADCPLPGVETESRGNWTQRILDGVLDVPSNYRTTPSDRIDRLLTHPFYGFVTFALVMFVMFQAVFSWAVPLMDMIIALVGHVEELLIASLAETSLAGGAIESLLVRGVLGGVGSVLVFLPQILMLFFLIALLEQCGYMARAAYLMDRVMARVGLSGQAFIPLLCCFACAVPGIMATRTISDHRSRLTTILVAPLIPCSARLLIYTLLIAAFVPSQKYLGGLINLHGLVMMAIYLLGVFIAVVVAMLLKRTTMRGPAAPLLMEMPAYQWPSPRAVLFRVVERGWYFIRAAGTAILVVSILIWAALYYPRPAEIEAPFAPRRAALTSSLAEFAADSPDRAAVETDLARLDRDVEAAYQRQSILARLGHSIEPAVRPLGWDWRIGTAVLASFPQRESVIATLGVIFQNGKSSSQKADKPLGDRLREATWEGTDRPLLTLPVALSIMVFYALCAQCVATLAVIRRETGSWRWPLFTFTYMTALAYIGSLVTYRLGMWIAGLA